MPRRARVSAGDTIYHVINRANGRVQIFENDAAYQHFESLLLEAKELTDMRILAYCVMPNHFHLVLYPRTDNDLGAFMGWLTSTHVRQYRARTKSIGYGHLYQDRYKSFPVQTNTYASTLIQYVEQNPLRVKLVARAEDWRWSSLWRREKGAREHRTLLHPLPINLPADYLQLVNTLSSDDALATIRYSVNKGKPFGGEAWVKKTIDHFELAYTLRGPGRPRRT